MKRKQKENGKRAITNHDVQWGADRCHVWRWAQILSRILWRDAGESERQLQRIISDSSENGSATLVVRDGADNPVALSISWKENLIILFFFY